jgi:hypothetical protein
VRAVYGAGTDQMTEEQRATERAWLAMSREERALIYDTYDAVRARLDAPIETTATVPIGSDNRDPDTEPPAADDET